MDIQYEGIDNKTELTKVNLPLKERNLAFHEVNLDLIFTINTS